VIDDNERARQLIGAAAILSAAIATPVRAQPVTSEPGYCAFFHPYANCQNKGPGNPYTDPNYRRGPAGYDGTWSTGETVRSCSEAFANTPFRFLSDANAVTAAIEAIAGSKRPRFVGRPLGCVSASD
jgi:hypothetical protein